MSDTHSSFKSNNVRVKFSNARFINECFIFSLELITFFQNSSKTFLLVHLVYYISYTHSFLSYLVLSQMSHRRVRFFEVHRSHPGTSHQLKLRIHTCCYTMDIDAYIKPRHYVSSYFFYFLH